jgi:hypothetical protein
MTVSLQASVRELVTKGECLGALWVVVLGIHSIPCLADTVDVKSSLGLLASKLLARQESKLGTEDHPPAPLSVTSSGQTSNARKIQKQQVTMLKLHEVATNGKRTSVRKEASGKLPLYGVVDRLVPCSRIFSLSREKGALACRVRGPISRVLLPGGAYLPTRLLKNGPRISGSLRNISITAKNPPPRSWRTRPMPPSSVVSRVVS